MPKKKTVIFISVTSVMVLLVSILTIVYLRNDRKVTENRAKTDLKGGETINFSKEKKEGKRKKVKRIKKKKRKKKTIDRILSKVKLTENQKLQIKKIKKERSSRKKNLEKIKALRKKFRQSFKDNSSQEELLRLHEEIQSLKNRMTASEFEYLLKIRKILNPKQRKNFQRLKQKYKRQSKKR